MDVDVRQLVSELHPGIELESPVQGWVFLRDFSSGLQCYSSLSEKTGYDDRWAGICYFHLHEDMRAVELFYRAIANGVEAARINLAHALGYIERGDEVIPELLKVRQSSLPIYDRVLYFRVKSLHEETSGDLLTALNDAETAWELVQGAPQFNILAPDILSQLAVLNGRVGRAQTALTYIDRNLSISSGVDALRARIHRAQILITLGRFFESVAELSELDLNAAPRHLVAIVLVHRGEAEWALGNKKRAIDLFEAAVESAIELNIGYEEFLARVALALLYASEQSFEIAVEHLEYAERLVGDRSDRLYYRFREILIKRMNGSTGGAEAISELRTVEAELGKMGALQEQGWVKLHVAHELWKLGEEGFRSELDSLDSLAKVLKNPAFLARELVLLPEFTTIVEAQFDRDGTTEKPISVLTLGEERLLVGESEVHLPLRRGVELLAYFLEHRIVSLPQLLGDLFPGIKPRTARSYFHQFRHHLAKTLEGVSIVYDTSKGAYELVSKRPIHWDVEAARTGETGSPDKRFLPTATSDWSSALNRRLLETRSSD